MSRTTSYALSGTRNVREVTMNESVTGRGTDSVDALQSLLDNMERRCAQVRLELLELRREWP